MSKELPILFSTPMVRAIIDGKKTQTRRLISKYPLHEEYSKAKIIYDAVVADPNEDDIVEKLLKGACVEFDDGEWIIKSKWNVGDHLWVREKWKKNNVPMGWPYHYYQDDSVFTNKDNEKWTPSIFMPKKAARIWLEVTGLRVERLHDISWEDAVAEGCEGYRPIQDEPTEQYERLWETINGEGSWKENPFVLVIEFKKINQ